MEKSKLKILHLTTSLITGGTEKQLLFVLPKLNAFEHTICCLQQWGEIGEEFKRLKFTTTFIGAKSFLDIFNFKKIKEYRAILRQEQPNIVITYLPFADLWGRFFTPRKNIKIVCALRSTMKEWRYFPFIFKNNLTHFLVDYYIAVSNEVKRIYTKFGLPEKKIKVIYNGIDLKQFEGINKGGNLEIEKIRQKNDVLMGYVGRMRKERRHLFLFKSLQNILLNNQRLKLILIGDGPEKINLKKWVKEKKIDTQIIFLGQKDNIPAILKELDIYLHPSLYEGMSNALLEAMAAGCAIITTDIPENRELIENNKNGILINWNDLSQLEKIINKLADEKDLRLELGVKAKEKAQEFDIEGKIKEWEECLNTLS